MKHTIVFISAFTKAGVLSFQRYEGMKYITLSISEGYEMYFSLTHVSTGVIPLKCLLSTILSKLFLCQEFRQLIAMFYFVLGRKMYVFIRLPNVFYCRKYSVKFHVCLHNGFPAFENKPEI